MSEPRKKILVMTSTFPRWKGDLEPPFVYELSKRLSHYYKVHILAPHDKGAALSENFDQLKITRFRYFFTKYQTLAYDGGILSKLKQNPWRYLLVPLFMIAECWALIRLLRQEQFDLIHAHWLIPQGFIAVLACAFFKKPPPILCTSHGGDLFALRGKLFKRLKQIVLHRATALTVVSQAMQKTAVSIGAEASKIQVIPMGVDVLNQFIPPVNARRENSLLFVGRLVEKKGLFYLLAALPLIIKAHPNIILTIAGKGTDELKLKKQVIALNLAQHVNFIGAVENTKLPELYQSSEIIIFPSIIAENGDREGFGLVLVEALGCECAVASSDLPAMQDILSHHDNALIFEQKQSHALAEKVNDLLSQPKLRALLGKQGRQDMLKCYDWDIITKRYSHLMQDIMLHAQPEDFLNNT